MKTAIRDQLLARRARQQHLTAGIESLEARIVMAAGDLDFTYSGDGITKGQIFTHELRDVFGGLALQADGKILTVGTAYDDSFDNSARHYPDITIARLLPDGTLDASFGTQGRVLSDFYGTGESGEAIHEQGFAIRQLADGRILAAGQIGDDFMLLRYDSAGTLDRTFGVNGLVQTDFGGDDRALDIAIQASGRIVLAGSTSGNFALAGYTVDGVLDASFGNAGKVKLDLGGTDEATKIALQSDGKLLVAGTSGTDFAFARFSASGKIDTSFGAAGKKLIDAGGGADRVNGLAIQADGKIIAAGNGASGFAVARLSAAGVLDSTFGTAGISTITGSVAGDLVGGLSFQADGKIVVTGNSGGNLAVARFQPNGSADPSFATGGFFTTDIAASTDTAKGVVVQADGKIVSLANFDGGGHQDGALVRLTIAGALDSTFGSAGKAKFGFFAGSSIAGADSVAQADGKVIVVGTVGNGGQDAHTALIRFNADGSLDTSFGTNGQILSGFSLGGDRARAVALQTDGKIVVSGVYLQSNSYNYFVARYLSNGTLDTSFGTAGLKTIDVGGDDTVSDMLIDSQGRIVIAGTDDHYFFGSYQNFELVRLMPNGTLDTTLDGDGIVTTVIAQLETANAITLQSDGKLLVVGTSKGTGNGVIVRYNENGTLDSSFSGDGISFVDFGGSADAINAVALQADGRILVEGTVKRPFTGLDMAVIRLNTDGSRDTTFANQGIFISPLNGDQTSSGIAVQTDGRILISATEFVSDTIIVERLLGTGSLDPTFGEGGMRTFFVGDQASAHGFLTSDQKFIIAGGENAYFARGEFFVAVLDTASPVAPAQGKIAFTGYQLAPAAEGTVATVTVTRSGGSTGTATVHYATAEGTATEGDDYTAASGTLTFGPGVTSLTFAVKLLADSEDEGPETVRLELSAPTGGAILDHPDVALLTIGGSGAAPGALDPDLAANPEASQRLFGIPGFEVYQTLVQPDGKLIEIIQTGYFTDSIARDFVLQRFNHDGSIDTSFGISGIVNTDFNHSSDGAFAGVLLPDGKILVAGGTLGSGDTEPGLVRYMPDGSVDRTFGNIGRLIPSLAPFGGIVDIELLPDGKLLILDEQARVARLLPDGSVDSAFGTNGVTELKGIEQPFTEFGLHLALQPNGSIIVSGASDTDTIAVSRLTPAGKLDTSFGKNGIIKTATRFNPNQLAIQPDGKILVAGTDLAKTFQVDFGVVRFTKNGALDKTFGGTGSVTVNFTAGGFSGSDDRLFDMVLAKSGKIVLFGETYDSTDRNLALLRINANGKPDSSFGTVGKVILSYNRSSYNHVGALAIEADNRIVFAASTGTEFYKNNLTIGRVIGDPAPGQFSFTAPKYSVDENRPFGEVLIRRTGGADGLVTVRFTTTSGTATAGSDFTNATQILTFGPGETGKIVQIPVLDDSVAEGAETVNLRLDLPTGDSTIGTQSTATLSIFDGPGEFAFEFDKFAINEAGNSALITVVRALGSDGAVTVHYATSDAGATAGPDYTATSGSLNFANGQTVASFAVPILDDHVLETLKGVRLTLRAPTGGAKLGAQSVAVLNIFDDDLRLAANPGAPDLRFANDGSSTLDLGGNDRVFGTIQQADGKYLLVGTSEENFALGRFNADGSVDLSFGQLGHVLTDFGGTDSAQSVVEQADGKLVVAGYSVRDGTSDFVVARYLADGRLDRSFGLGGFVRTDIDGNHDQAFSVTLQSDGKIVVLGSTGDAFFRDFVVTRYESDGQLDDTFGGDDGIVLVDFENRFDVGADLEILADGSILVSGTTYFITEGANFVNFAGDVAIAKLKNTGALDPTFGDKGKVRAGFAVVRNNQEERVNSMAVSSDGKIYLVGANDGELAVYRFTAGGEIDSSFGFGGTVTESFVGGSSYRYSYDGAYDITFDSQGRLLVAGGSDYGLGLLRMLPSGRLDSSFGVNGLVVDYSLGNVRGVHVQPDGKIVTLGEAPGADYYGDFAIARFYGSSGDAKEGSFQFSELSYNVRESFGGVDAVVSVLRPLDNAFGEVSVDYYTLPGFAAAGVNYTPVQGTLTFEAGETSKYFVVPILDSPGTDGFTLNMFIALANPTGGAVLGSQPTSQIFIETSGTTSDTPTFSFSGTTVNESAGTLTLTVVRSGSKLLPASVDFTTAAGTALEGDDFNPVFGALNFAANQTSATITIPIVADGILEPDETFSVNLTNPRGAKFYYATSVYTGTVTIHDTDPTVIHNAGDVDTAWGTNGRTTTDFGETSFEALLATAQQPDGKIVGVGYSGRGGDFALVRYNLDGTLDTTFGKSGKVLTDIRPGGDTARAVNVIANGKIQVIGTSIGDGREALVIARYNANGSLDSTFGSGGKVLYNLATFRNDFEQTVFQPDGKILLGGSILNATLDSDVAMIRFNADGTLDSTFGANGLSTYDFGGSNAFRIRYYPAFDEDIKGLTLQPDGNIVATLDDHRLLRFTSSGQIDTTFGDRGIVTVNTSDQYANFGPITSLADGKLLVGGSSGSRAVVYRLTPQGALDPAFGVGGVATSESVSYSAASDLMVQPDGRIIISGGGLARFYSDGVVDIGFGDRGHVASSYSGLLLQQDGKVLAFGGFSDFESVRYVGGTAAGGVRLEGTSFRVSEDGTSIVLNVVRTGGMDGAVSVHFATANGTALAGTDFTAVSGDIAFGDRDITPKTITIPITNDNLAQGNLSFTLALTNPTGGAIVRAPFGQTSIQIVDDEAPGKLVFASSGYSVSENGGFLDVTLNRIEGDGGAVSVRVTSANGTATAAADYVAVDTIVNFAAAEVTKTVRLTVSPDAIAELNETLILTLSAPTGGATLGFRPATQVTIVDGTPVSVALSTASSTVSEGSGLYNVTVVRSGPLEGYTSASIRMIPGTAFAGQDFLSLPATVLFAPGETSKTVGFPIVDDSTVEGTEQFSIVLTTTADVALGSAQTIVTILDDDVGVLNRFLSIGNSSVTEGNAGTTNAVFTVSLTSPSGEAVTVNFATLSVTAGSGDFTPMSGTLTFNPGELTKTISVPIIGDRLAETRETFLVMLSSPTGAEIDDAQGLGTILDDDGDVAAGIQFTQSLFQTFEHTRTVELTLFRGLANNDEVTLPYSLTAGSAGPLDFTATPGTVAFAVGAHTATISVPIRPDFIGELTEDFTVTLGTPSAGALLGNRNVATVQIIDDDPSALPDVNNDGRPDLVQIRSGKIQVHLNPGDGDFNPIVPAAQLITSVTKPAAFVAADLDGDGKVDLAVLNSGKRTVSLLHGNGDGTFDSPTVVSAGNARQKIGRQLITGDFNGDGLADLALLQAGGVNVLLNNSTIGDLNFSPGAAALRAKGFTRLATGDFDENGTLDIAMFGGRTFAINVFSGFGTGGFATKGIASKITPGMKAMQLADADGDGRLDLIGILPKNVVGILHGGDRSVFGEGKATVERIKTDANPATLGLGDFNNDLGLDFVTTSSKIASIVARQGNSYTTPQLIPSGFKAKVSFVTDLDGDGDLDILLLASNGKFKVVKP